MTCINHTAACAVFSVYHFILELRIRWIGHAHKSEIIDWLLAGVKAGLVLLFLWHYCSHDAESSFTEITN